MDDSTDGGWYPPPPPSGPGGYGPQPPGVPAPQAQGPYGPPPAGPPAPPGRGPSSTRVAVIAVAGTLVVVAVVVGAFLLGRGGSGDDEEAATTTSTESTPTTTSSTTTAPPPPSTTTTVPPPSGPGDVRAEPAGLFCRDLAARGYSYSASVTYWQGTGQPTQMDADRDGIPCETVYPVSDVISYWGTTGRDVTPEVEVGGIYGLPSGLMCRDLRNRGYDVYEAIAYYLINASPPNMDADGNGIPCETVYPDAMDAWYGV